MAEPPRHVQFSCRGHSNVDCSSTQIQKLWSKLWDIQFVKKKGNLLLRFFMGNYLQNLMGNLTYRLFLGFCFPSFAFQWQPSKASLCFFLLWTFQKLMIFRMSDGCQVTLLLVVLACNGSNWVRNHSLQSPDSNRKRLANWTGEMRYVRNILKGYHHSSFPRIVCVHFCTLQWKVWTLYQNWIEMDGNK